MGTGNARVAPAKPDTHRHGDAAQVEAPGTDQDEANIDPPVQAAEKRRAYPRHPRRARPGGGQAGVGGGGRPGGGGAGRATILRRLLPARRGLTARRLSRSAQPERWRHSLARSPYTTSSRRPSGKASPCRSSPSSTKPSRRARARLRSFAGSVCNETRSMPSAPKA